MFNIQIKMTINPCTQLFQIQLFHLHASLHVATVINSPDHENVS